MSLQTAPDIPLLITSTSTSSERRVSPGWTLEHFKARMEAVTGIPPSVQSLVLKLGGSQAPVPMVGEQRTLGEFGLAAYGEIEITDTRPPGLRESFTDTSTVPKYSMDPNTYESLTDTVLAFKKQNKLGRFDPQAPDILTQKTQLIDREVSERHIVLGARCQLLAASPTAAADARRGTVRYIGPVPEIPGGVGSWVGVELDEPVGKNDGSVGGARYFECGVKCGVFVRPARVEVGDFEALDELGEEMEEM